VLRTDLPIANNARCAAILNALAFYKFFENDEMRITTDEDKRITVFLKN